MSLDTMFTFLLLLVVVVVAVAVGGAIYIAVIDRWTRRETGRQVGTADIAVGAGPDEDYGISTGEAEHRVHEPRREFYKSMGLETTEDMKLRVYSIERSTRPSLAGPMPVRTAASWPRSKPTGNWTTSGTTTPHARRRRCSSSHRRTTRWTENAWLSWWGGFRRGCRSREGHSVVADRYLQRRIETSL